MSGSRWPGLLVALLGGLLACGAESEAPPAAAPARGAAPLAAAPKAPVAAPAAEALQIFGTRCATCHGPEGAGDGPGSAALQPPPRNFRDPAWQASVSDEHLERIVQFGGAAVGRSPAMPGNPDLLAKPEVVAALRQHLRSLGAR